MDLSLPLMDYDDIRTLMWGQALKPTIKKNSPLIKIGGGKLKFSLWTAQFCYGLFTWRVAIRAILSDNCHSFNFTLLEQFWLERCLTQLHAISCHLSLFPMNNSQNRKNLKISVRRITLSK